MKSYKTLAKEFLSKYAKDFRMRQNLTQEKMAEQLRITSRAYVDLEHGKYCFSAVTLLFFLLMLDDAELKGFLKDFRKKVYELEYMEAIY